MKRRHASRPKGQSPAEIHRKAVEAGPMSEAEKRAFRAQWLQQAAQDDSARSGSAQPLLFSNQSVPAFWIDQNGRRWKTPTIRGRLKHGRCAGHRALREFVIARDKCCQECGATQGLVADHIVSRRNGGSHHPSNMQALCVACNARKASLVDARAGRA